MLDIKEIIASIETIEKQKNDAIAETNDLRIRVWTLEQELDKQRQETAKWKDISLKLEEINK